MLEHDNSPIWYYEKGRNSQRRVKMWRHFIYGMLFGFIAALLLVFLGTG